MNMAPISEPNTMMPATAATQNTGRAATFRSYSGFVGPALSEYEGDRGGQPDGGQAEGERAGVGHGGEVDGQDDRPTSTTERMPPRLSTDSVVSFTWAGMSRIVNGMATIDQRHGDQEHRAPPEVLQQDAGDQRPERPRSHRPAPTRGRWTWCGRGRTTAR